MRKLVTFIKPGRLLAATLRHGLDDGHGSHDVEALARDYGLAVVLCTEAPDALGRSDVR